MCRLGWILSYAITKAKVSSEKVDAYKCHLKHIYVLSRSEFLSL